MLGNVVVSVTVSGGLSRRLKPTRLRGRLVRAGLASETGVSEMWEPEVVASSGGYYTMLESALFNPWSAPLMAAPAMVVDHVLVCSVQVGRSRRRTKTSGPLSGSRTGPEGEGEGAEPRDHDPADSTRPAARCPQR